MRQLLENFDLHDADVLGMGRKDDSFHIVLQLDTPPHDLLMLTYALTGELVIDRAALPPQYRSSRMKWLHEEMELISGGNQKHYLISILFSNGWEVQLPFHDLHWGQVQGLFPVPRTSLKPPLAVPQSA